MQPLLLKPTIQNYHWGSKNYLSDNFGVPNPEGEPQAELWIGAHPYSPSLVVLPGREEINLNQFIKDNTQEILGSDVKSLPFLFKILAINEPLSIQCHPNLTQAQEGFKKEEGTGFDINDNMTNKRNYKDPLHKPEMLYALTKFQEFYNFRNPQDIIQTIEKIGCKPLSELTEPLKSNDLKTFYQSLFSLKPETKEKIIKEALAAVEENPTEQIFKDIKHLSKFYPTDLGILAPIYLNKVTLEPGQTMFVKAGEVHCYVSGVGVETQTNSDNSIRCGLTPKHMDVEELFRIAKFETKPINTVPQKTTDSTTTFQPPVEEFEFSVISVKNQPISINPNSVEILFCSKGQIDVQSQELTQPLSLNPGQACLIPVTAGQYQITGNGEVMRVNVPEK